MIKYIWTNSKVDVWYLIGRKQFVFSVIHSFVYPSKPRVVSVAGLYIHKLMPAVGLELHNGLYSK